MSKAKKPLIIAIAAAAVLILLFFIILRPVTNLFIGKSELENGNTESACEILNKNYGTYLWEKSKAALAESGTPYIGGTYEYGTYSQDESGQNTPIVWDILDVYGNKILLISHDVIDCEPYETKADVVRMKSAETEIVTWKSCHLREFLNSDFMVYAFTDGESDNIAITDVVTSYKKHSTESQNQYNYVDKTEDKMFILSAAEAEKYLSDDTSLAAASTYAINRSVKYDATSGNAAYWLRSPGFDQDYAAYMNYDGSAINGTEAAPSCSTMTATIGVRPAMWVYIGTDGENAG